MRLRRSGTDVALIGYGSPVNDCLAAAEMLAAQGVSATVVDARFCKPLDTDMLRQLAREHPVMITVEEGSIGGFAAHVMQVRRLCSLRCGRWLPHRGRAGHCGIPAAAQPAACCLLGCRCACLPACPAPRLPPSLPDSCLALS